ncbi:MAG: thioredoxin family protein, partial [Oligoflexia bacterium]|nr:thioredoxin family protein [Oligoflexia bacterium]
SMVSVFAAEALPAILPCVNVTDISAPTPEQLNQRGCVQRSEANRRFTLMIFAQVYCGACKQIVSDMPNIWERLKANTTIRVVMLDRYSEAVLNYAKQPSLAQVLVCSDKEGGVNGANFARDFGIRYTPSLILVNKDGQELYRAPLRGERRGADANDIAKVIEITSQLPNE